MILPTHSAWRHRFLRLMRRGNTVQQSARMINVGLERINQERRRDPKFAAEIVRLDDTRVPRAPRSF